MIIDTHSHLYDEDFAEDIDAVIERARAADVGKVFLPNINATTVEPMMALVRHYPDYLYPMIGLHPEDLTDDWRDVLEQMEQQLAALEAKTQEVEDTKNRFVKNMMYEIRQPMDTVTESAEKLSTGTDKQQESEITKDIIENAGYHCHQTHTPWHAGNPCDRHELHH